MAACDNLGIFAKLHIIAHTDDETFDVIANSSGEMIMIFEGVYPTQYEKRFGNCTNYLYMTRCQSLYSKKVLNCREQNMDWKTFYERSTDLFNGSVSCSRANTYAHFGKLMELKILNSLDIDVTQNGLWLAIQNNQMHIVEWLFSLPSLKLLFDTLFKESPPKYSLDTLASDGNLEMLKFLYDKLKILPTSFGADLALNKNHKALCEWLITLDTPIYPTVRGPNWALANGNIEIVKWLISLDSINNPLTPTQNGINWAACNEHIEALEFMTQYTKIEFGPMMIKSFKDDKKVRTLHWYNKYRSQSEESVKSAE